MDLPHHGYRASKLSVKVNHHVTISVDHSAKYGQISALQFLLPIFFLKLDTNGLQNSADNVAITLQMFMLAKKNLCLLIGNRKICFWLILGMTRYKWTILNDIVPLLTITLHGYDLI